jgi:UDP-N-acetyl-alpha-D-muramoyl-L-alanyl-L-glutamate epimerase
MGTRNRRRAIMTAGSEPALNGPFIFERTEIDGGRVALEYRIGDGLELAEIVEFPFRLPDAPAVSTAVRILHLIAGVSYYKCVAPTALLAPPLLDDERALLRALYDDGLREFAYRNGLPVPLPVDVREGPGDAPTIVAPVAPHPVGALVPVGGGKDSALVADLVPDGRLMTVNPTGAHERFAASLGRPLLRVTRRLDPRLRELVESGAPNGHVPVTAITSAIAVVVASSLGIRDVVMGLERSASEPSLVVAGAEINHQFSKSLRAERLLAAAFAPLAIRYFSLLRPLTELAIGTSLARRGLAGEIVSCNRVFTVWNENTASREQRPCGECAKCLFTALMLAPSLDPSTVRAHFGHDVFDDPRNIEGVRALWSDAKPFDCVGERMESAAAVAVLHDSPAWKHRAVVDALAPEARALLAAHATSSTEYLRVDPVDALPSEYRDRIRKLASELTSEPEPTDAP